MLGAMSTPQRSNLPLWVLGSVLCLLGLYVAGLNWAALVINIRNKRQGIAKRYSQGPVIGPLLGYLGLRTLPTQKSFWVWLVLLVDPSTWVVLVSLPYLFRQARSAEPPAVRSPLYRVLARIGARRRT